MINKHQLSGFEALDEHMTLWTQDVSFILNRLEQLNKQDEQDRFTGRLDLERIGMFGHSYGGATAADLLKDSRIKVRSIWMGPYMENPCRARDLISHIYR